MDQSIARNGKRYSRFWFIFTLLVGTFTMSISQSSNLNECFWDFSINSSMADDWFYARNVCQHAN